MVVFVEADKKEKLLSFYENYGFKRFDTRQTASNDKEFHELVQLFETVVRSDFFFFKIYRILVIWKLVYIFRN